MRSTCHLLMMIALLGLVPGCGLFSGARRPAEDRPNLAERDRSDRLPPQPFERDKADATKGRGNSGRGAMLAGSVIDSFNKRLPRATIVIESQDSPNQTVQPREIQTDESGFFIVNGLEPGRKYKLTAKAQSGEILMTGHTEVSPPNSVIVIKLDQESKAGEVPAKSTGNSGSIGGVHRSIIDNTGEKQNSGNNGYLYERDQGPIRPRTDYDQPKLGKPVIEKQPGFSSEPQKESRPPVRPEYITKNEENDGRPPVMSIPPFPATRRDSGESTTSKNNLNALEFPLMDLDQKPHTISDFKGKLTLVDVWSTSCVPCIKALPEMVKLRSTYGKQGLSVVGLAIDEKGSANDISDRIRYIATRNRVEYPILREDPVKPFSVSFEIHSIPTILLLDEQGKVLLKLTGLSEENKRQLEQEITRRLAN